MNNNKITRLIYDLDGLLLDTEPMYTEATAQILERFGKKFNWSIKSRMMGKKAIDSARILIELTDIPMSPENFVAERSSLLADMFPGVTFKPGAKRLTNHFHACPIPQAIATSCHKESLLQKVKNKKLWFDIFSIVVTGDDDQITSGKPEPDIFLITAERLGAKAEECLVFEDSPSGVLAAVKAGMPVIAIPDEHIDHSRVKEADLILSSLEDFDPVSWGLPPLNNS